MSKEMSMENRTPLGFGSAETAPKEIPPLDAQTANQLLNNVFTSCDMKPSVIPVEVLESWGNYKKPVFNFGRFIAYIGVVLLVLLPLIFLLSEWIGLAGVEIAQALSDGLTAIISIPFVFYYFQKSEKKRTKKQTSDGKRQL